MDRISTDADAWHDALRMVTLRRGCLLWLLTTCLLWADGGKLILRQQAGPLTISVFCSPETARVGAVDLSVMVQRTQDQSSVTDADVKVRLTHSGVDGISDVFAPATHAKATNKLLYAAQVNLPATGTWKLAADAQSRAGSAEVAGQLVVLPPATPLQSYWPFFAVVPLLIVLFLINQRLRKKRGLNRWRARA